MAGHSKFKNIMHRKAAQDKKRASSHGRVLRELRVAARLGGVDAAANPRLRLALSRAKAVNVQKEAIKRALTSSTGGADDMYEDVRYEGFGPAAVAFIVEAQTNNRHRTAADLRSLFHKHGGNLADEGSVVHGFEHVGVICYDMAQQADDKDRFFERLFHTASEHGAEDVERDGDICRIIVSYGSYLSLYEVLENHFAVPTDSSVMWRPLRSVKVSSSQRDTLAVLMAQLDAHDDVTAFFSNHIDEAMDR